MYMWSHTVVRCRKVCKVWWDVHALCTRGGLYTPKQLVNSKLIANEKIKVVLVIDFLVPCDMSKCAYTNVYEQF